MYESGELPEAHGRFTWFVGWEGDEELVADLQFWQHKVFHVLWQVVLLLMHKPLWRKA